MENMSLSDCGNSDVTIAIFEKADQKIGLAVVDLKLCSLVLNQFSDFQNYSNLINKIQVYDPKEVLISSSPFGSSFTNKLKKILQDYFENVILIELKIRHFNARYGLESISKICNMDYKLQTEITTKPLALAACGALLKFVESSKNYCFVPNSIRLLLENNQNSTLIGVNSARYLELVHNQKNLKGKNNLLSVLDYTQTKFGNKALLSTILQPPCNIELIQNRSDIINELINDTNLMNQLSEMIANFTDLESISKQLNLFGNNQIDLKSSKVIETKIQSVINMRIIVESVHKMLEVLKSSGCDRLKDSFCEYFEEEKFEKLHKEISEVIDEQSKTSKKSLSVKINKCFAIRPNINELLDVSRRAFSEMIQDIQIYTEELCEAYQMPIKYAYNTTRGFYFQINHAGLTAKSNLNQSSSSVFSTFSFKFLENLPKEFLKLIKTKSSIQFTTDKLLKINSRINASMYDIYFISNKIIDELILKLQDEFIAFYRLKEFLSLLDLNLSFAKYALSSTGFTRPKFENIFFIKNSLHPVLHKIKEKIEKNLTRNDNTIVSSDELVKNTIKMSDTNSFIILTGANMSGKSTLLRQIGNLQIIAQCGSSVPAEEAIFTVKNKILTLSADYDDPNISLNTSSFECEINQIKNIIDNLTDNCLILIDEMGKHTNYYEGLSITFSLCKHILDYLIEKKAKNVHIVFATHFKELSYLECCYSIVKSYHLMSMIETEKKLNHTYKLETGICEIQNYGQKLVELSALPETIIQDSKNIIKFFDFNLERVFEKNETDLKKQLIFRMFNDLKEIAQNIDEIDNVELYHKVDELVKQFQLDYSKISNF